MPANQKGSLPIIISIIVILIALTGAYYLGQKNSFKVTQSNPSSSPVAVVETKAFEKKEISDWQKYNLKFGQINIYYPPKWLVKDVDYLAANYGSDYRSIYFFPVEQSVVTEDNIIYLSVQLDQSQNPPVFLPDNFIIPALGDKPNANYSQQNNQTTLTFKHSGVLYILSLNLDAGLRTKLDPTQLTDIFNKMAKTLEFTNQTGTCDDPVLKPLADFPANFMLVNRHASDASDKVAYYYPEVLNPGTNSYFDPASLNN